MTTPNTLEAKLRALHDDGPGDCRHGADCPWMKTIRTAAALALEYQAERYENMPADDLSPSGVARKLRALAAATRKEKP